MGCHTTRGATPTIGCCTHPAKHCNRLPSVVSYSWRTEMETRQERREIKLQKRKMAMPVHRVKSPRTGGRLIKIATALRSNS
jgi:hypothetical protein